MDGGAIGYPIAIVFMAEAAGLGHIVGSVEYVLIVVVATIGAVGAGPVPASGIVMTMTIWSSVFPGTPLPSSFAFIVAVDWFLDRFYTVRERDLRHGRLPHHRRARRRDAAAAGARGAAPEPRERHGRARRQATGAAERARRQRAAPEPCMNHCIWEAIPSFGGL
ncbi:hypothetical protein PINS_up024030 [Pythium insidiosum]|nr:hypothetical protein PINS_up024030 [Pythium insidiosum]